MGFRITCYTLFDITQTGVLNRPRINLNEDQQSWLKKRNTQVNFDTILQIINLRSQPENITTPLMLNIKFNEFENFGSLFTQKEDETYPCWKFNFEISHLSVFDDGISELGSLYEDCHGVPMILCGDEWNKLTNLLDGSPELRNIYFKVES